MLSDLGELYVHTYTGCVTVFRDYSVLSAPFYANRVISPFLSTLRPSFHLSLSLVAAARLSLSLSLAPARPSILSLASLSVDSSWGSWRRGDALPDHPLTTSQWFSFSISSTFPRIHARERASNFFHRVSNEISRFRDILSIF